MFESVIGHTRQKQILERKLESGKLPHAFLFTGPEGIGKEKLATAFTAELLAFGSRNPENTKRRAFKREHPDLINLGGDGKRIKIDEIRSMIKEVYVRSFEGGLRVICIDDADLMTTEAQNALLKTLEEPPKDVVFLLITAKLEKLLPTVVSRCEKLAFERLAPEEQEAVLDRLGLSAYKGFSPQEAQRMQAIPGLQEDLQRAQLLFLAVQKGEASQVFPLAELLSQDQAFTEDAISLFTAMLRRQAEENPSQTDRILSELTLLFELKDSLQYNINLRLQWESCLIKLKNHWS